MFSIIVKIEKNMGNFETIIINTDAGNNPNIIAKSLQNNLRIKRNKH